MKKIVITALLLLTILVVLTGCSEKQLVSNKLESNKLESNSIDKIQVVKAMGNPMYGADSKIITDKAEIKLFIDTFNSRIIGKAADEDISDVFASYYDFYFEDELVIRFSFNGNNSNIIWQDNNFYYVSYDQNLKTPWELYQSSNAQVIVVDEEGNIMERPQE